MERNEYLESDGLYYESETHEWFNDKLSTQSAHKENLKHLYCFVVREKVNGKYDRVIMDSKSNEIIYSSQSLDDIAFFIDKQKIIKRFE